MQDEALAEEILSTLRRAGYKSELIEYPREHRSIDIAGYSSDKRILLKASYDVSNITRHELDDLRKARLIYRASTIIIGVRENNAELEEDVVYYKHNNIVVTPETFEKYITRREKPLVARIRGTYVLKINPEKLKARREETGLSKGSLAEILGTSKKTVYMYERGEIYISLDKGLRLASLLGEDVFDEFDILEEKDIPDADLREETTPRDKIEEALLKLTRSMQCLYTSFYRMPIDAVVKMREALSIVKKSMDNRDAEEKIEYARKLAESVGTRIFIIRSPRDVAEIKKLIY